MGDGFLADSDISAKKTNGNTSNTTTPTPTATRLPAADRPEVYKAVLIYVMAEAPGVFSAGTGGMGDRGATAAVESDRGIRLGPVTGAVVAAMEDVTAAAERVAPVRADLLETPVALV